jgi:hypothetical protein
MVAGLVDQTLGFGEVALGEVIVGEKELHAGAAGDAQDFLEIVVRAASEEGAWKVVKCSRPVEEFDGLVEMMNRFGAAQGVRAAERKVVEADVKKPAVPLGDDERFGSPAQDFGSLTLVEEQVAISIALDRMQD